MGKKRKVEEKDRRASSSDDDRDRRRRSRRSSDDRDKEEVAKMLAQKWAEEDEEDDDDEEEKDTRAGGWSTSNTGSKDAKQERAPAERQPEKQAERGAWGHQARVAAAFSSGTSSSTKKVPGVFGLSDDEDEEQKKKEMERAAQNRAKRMPGGIATAGSSTDPAGGPATPRGGSGSSSDLSTILMKMAEWKRQCGGKRVPMPDDMKAAVAAAMRGSV